MEKPTLKDNVLHLKKGDAYKIKVENPSEMEKSPFRDVYDQAINAFGQIDKDNQKEISSDSKVDRLAEFNTVIGFCGERGSGKTSAMVSFRNFLNQWNDPTKHPTSNLYVDLKSQLSKEETRFVCLDTIDPSRFEPHDRLIGSILGELYRRYDDALKGRRDQQETHDSQRKVEEALKDVLTAVQLLSNSDAQPFGTPGAGENTFDILKRVGKAANTRVLMHRLVQTLLDFLLGKEKLYAYLVIPVDDLDMSVQHAYILAEDIRKYFMIPNVVILLAAKVDQLRMAVEQSYVERFKHYMRELQKPDREEIESMSNLYLEKLIPLARRIPMLDVSAIRLATGLTLNWEGNGKQRIGKIDQIVLQMIYEKTTLRFVKGEFEVHPIVPRTLRELHNFLVFLDDLQDIPFEITEIDDFHLKLDTALSRFRTYILQEWVPRVLPRPDEDAIQEIEVSGISHRLKTTGRILARRLAETSLPLSYNPFSQNKRNAQRQSVLKEFASDLNRIFDSKTLEIDYSLGNIRTQIAKMEKDGLNGESKLSFAIQTIISIDIVRAIQLHSGSETEFISIVNGAFVAGEDLICKPQRFLADSEFVSNRGNRLVLRIKPFEESGKEYSAREYLDKYLDANAAGLDQAKIERIRYVIRSFLFLGDVEVGPKSDEYDGPWFNYLEPSDKHGAGTPTVTIDFEAFLFWMLIPMTNASRFEENPDLEVTQNTRAQIDRQFWSELLQLETFSAFRTHLRKSYISKRKANFFDNPKLILRTHLVFDFFCISIAEFFKKTKDDNLGFVKLDGKIPAEWDFFDRTSSSHNVILEWFKLLDGAVTNTILKFRSPVVKVSNDQVVEDATMKIISKSETEVAKLSEISIPTSKADRAKLRKIHKYMLNLPKATAPGSQIYNLAKEYRRLSTSLLNVRQNAEIFKAITEFEKSKRTSEMKAKLAQRITSLNPLNL